MLHRSLSVGYACAAVVLLGVLLMVGGDGAKPITEPPHA
jgi:hypothetical protein